MEKQWILRKLEEMIRRGAVSRIVIRRRGEPILNLSLGSAAVGTVLGLSFAKWLTLAAAVAGLGSGCTVEVLRPDGRTTTLLDEEGSRRLRESFPVRISVNTGDDREESALPDTSFPAPGFRSEGAHRRPTDQTDKIVEAQWADLPVEEERLEPIVLHRDKEDFDRSGRFQGKTGRNRKTQ